VSLLLQTLWWRMRSRNKHRKISVWVCVSAESWNTLSDENSQWILRKCGEAQIPRNYSRNQNCIHAEIQNILSSPFLDNQNLTCPFMWIWNSASNTERTWIEGSFRTGCWGEYLNLRERKWQEAGEVCIMRSFMTCTLYRILLGWSNHGVWDGWDM